MRKKISMRGIVLLVIVALLTLGLTGCPDINDMTGTLIIDIDDNYT